jgi:beta-hydroxylase
MTFFSSSLIVLYVYLSAVVYVHYRGRARLRLIRQLTDHSALLAPYNVLMYLCSAVPRGPILDPGEFPELRPLQDNWRTIRGEAARLLASERLRPAFHHDDIAFNSFFHRGWRRFYVKWYDHVLPSAQATCPETVRLVRSIPSVNAALFALLPPGGRLSKHRDPFAGSLRYHLGLLTPNNDRCRIYVDGRPCSWRDGEALVFDETYVHRAVNETCEPRVILFCDVTRPLRFPPVRWINQLVIRHVVKLTAARNDESEKIGAVNHVSPLVHRTGVFFQGIRKRSNRRIYNVVRYGLLGAALGTLCWAALG